MDNRTKRSKEIKVMLAFITGILIGGMGVKNMLTPSWESQQLTFKGTELVSPMSLDELNIVKPVEAQESLPKPTPTPDPKQLVIDEIKRVFGNDSEMLDVAFCESGYRWNAKNPNSSATGVFQIMAGVHGISPRFLYDYKINIAVAKKLYDEQGTNPWISSIGCWQ